MILHIAHINRKCTFIIYVTQIALLSVVIALY